MRHLVRADKINETCCHFVGGRNSRRDSPQLTKAEIWSEAVAKFVTDPQFYRQVPVERIKERFLPLLRPEQLNFFIGPGRGSNPEMGIVDAFINLRTLERGPGITRKQGIEQLVLTLETTDPDGNQIYPILKAKLLRRLRKPVWNLKADEKFYTWRKGETPYVVIIDLKGFVVVTAAWEEGDSEDP
jgi:hypothetical protein